MGLPPDHSINIAQALRQAVYDGAVWSITSDQLNVNLLRLSTGATIAAHVNHDLDVLLVVVEGSGELTIDDTLHPLQAGQVVVVPRSSTRAIRCTAGPLVYLTCHHRRRALMPS